MPDEILTIKEAAALLKLAEKSVYGTANAGEISCVQDTRSVAHQAGRVGPVARAESKTEKRSRPEKAESKMGEFVRSSANRAVLQQAELLSDFWKGDGGRLS